MTVHSHQQCRTPRAAVPALLRPLLTPVLLLVLVAAGTNAAVAQARYQSGAEAQQFPTNQAPLLLAANAALTLEQATLKVREAFGGKVVAAGAAERDGRPGYRVRVLSKDGRMRTVFVDAQNGKISRS